MSTLMLRFVTASVEFYQQVLSAFPDTESLTVLLASGVTREAVLEALAADVSNPAEDAWDIDEESTAWAAIEVPGGVLAIELSGYGDPSMADLASLSASGASAVVRSNVQAHYRFGCARAGEQAGCGGRKYATLGQTSPDKARGRGDGNPSTRIRTSADGAACRADLGRRRTRRVGPTDQEDARLAKRAAAELFAHRARWPHFLAGAYRRLLGCRPGAGLLRKNAGQERRLFDR